MITVILLLCATDVRKIGLKQNRLQIEENLNTLTTIDKVIVSLGLNISLVNH